MGIVKGGTFGADTAGIGGVFLIIACEDGAVGKFKGTPYTKMGIRGVGFCSSLTGLLNQLLFRSGEFFNDSAFVAEIPFFFFLYSERCWDDRGCQPYFSYHRVNVSTTVGPNFCRLAMTCSGVFSRSGFDLE